MWKIDKILCVILVYILVLACTGIEIFAGNDQYNDYWCDGPFPETGVLLDWHFGKILPGMDDTTTTAGKWYTSGPVGHTWGARFNSLIAETKLRVKPDAVMPEQGGAKSWHGATKVESGRLSVSQMVYVPSGMVSLGKYTVYTSLWNDDNAAEQGVLFNVNLDNPADPWIGFNTKKLTAMTDRNQEVSNGVGEFYPIDCNKWYKIEAVINYDGNRIDYYLNGEYKCSMANPDLIDWYDLLVFDIKALNVWDNPKTASAAVKGAEAWIAEVKLERLNTTIEPKIVSSGKRDMTILFQYQLDADVDGSEFFFPDYEVESTAINDKEIIFTFAEDIEYSKPVVLQTSEDISFNGIDMKVEKGSVYAFPPQYSDKDLINQKFDNITFPIKDNSGNFDEFYVQYQQGDKPFVTRKDYTWENVSAVNEIGGGTGKALALHRSSENTSADYRGENANISLVIPFDDGRTINGGNFIIELDAGKMSNDKINADPFTVGLHDKNNEITEYDVYNAWSNSTAFFQVGEYNQTAQLIFKPRGRSGGYSHYYMNKKDTPAVTSACLWPKNPNDAQNSVGEVYHYKMEVDLSNGIYDLYKDGLEIGDQLSIPDTANNPEYDAFVVGMGFDPRDDAKAKGVSRYTYIDNIKVTKTPPLNLVDVRHGDKNELLGTEITEGEDVVFNFSAPVTSVEKVCINGVPTTDYTMVGNSVKIASKAFKNNLAIVSIENVASTDLTTYPSYEVTFNVKGETEASVECYDIQNINNEETAQTIRFFFDVNYNDGPANAYGAYIIPLGIFSEERQTVLVNNNDTIDSGATFAAELTNIDYDKFGENIATIGFIKLNGKYYYTESVVDDWKK